MRVRCKCTPLYMRDIYRIKAGGQSEVREKRVGIPIFFFLILFEVRGLLYFAESMLHEEEDRYNVSREYTVFFFFSPRPEGNLLRVT